MLHVWKKSALKREVSASIEAVGLKCELHNNYTDYYESDIQAFQIFGVFRSERVKSLMAGKFV